MCSVNVVFNFQNLNLVVTCRFWDLIDTHADFHVN